MTVTSTRNRPDSWAMSFGSGWCSAVVVVLAGDQQHADGGHPRAGAQRSPAGCSLAIAGLMFIVTAPSAHRHRPHRQRDTRHRPAPVVGRDGRRAGSEREEGTGDGKSHGRESLFRPPGPCTRTTARMMMP